MSSLRRTAVKGFLWQVFGLIGQRGAAFLASIVLARLLVPEDFGVVAIALAVITFAEMLRVGGLVPAFIAHQETDKSARHTVFWLGLAAGFGFFAIMFFGAPYAAAWFNAPKLDSILRALSFTQLVDSFRTVPFAIMVRDYRFKEKSIAESLPMLVAVPAGIVAAWVLPVEQRAWALVVMFLIRYLLSTILVLRYEPYKPRAVFNGKFARQLSAEGRRILLTSIPASALDPLSRLGLGARIDVGSVGVFNLASAVTMPPTFLAYAANWTLFPIIANNIDDHKRIERYLVRSLKSVGLLSLGVLAWLALVSPDLLPIVFGEKWLAVVVPTQWLCLATAFRNYVLLATNALMAYKKYTPANVIWWVGLALLVGLFVFWPMPADSSIVAAQLFAAAMGVTWLLTVIFTAKAFKLQPSHTAATVLVPVVPSILGAGAAWLARFLLREGLESWMRLLLETAVFVAVFTPVAGKMLGGHWFSLFTVSGVRGVIRGTRVEEATHE
ncbi:MAG: oligosaccharide flippase family protein [Fimbriimonadales bacterium]